MVGASGVLNQDEIKSANERSAQARSFTDRCLTVKVTDQVTYEHAAQLFSTARNNLSVAERAVKDLRKRFDDLRNGIVRTFFEPTVSKYLAAVQHLDGEMMAYRKKVQEEEENRRLKEEAKAREKAAKDREKLEAKAAKAEANGREEVAELYRDKADQVTVQQGPMVTPKIQSPKGITVRTTWYAEVVDIKKLIDAVAAGKVVNTVLQPNQVALNRMAALIHDNKDQWPAGVVFKTKESFQRTRSADADTIGGF